MQLQTVVCSLMCSMSVHYIIQKTLNTNKCTKNFFVNYNTLLHVSTLLGHLRGETSRCRYTKLHSLNCIVQPSVTTTDSFPLKLTQQGRNMECVIIDEKTLFTCWCLMFLVVCSTYDKIFITVFKIKHKLYIASGTAPPPPLQQGKILGAPLWRVKVFSLIKKKRELYTAASADPSGRAV
jgi:hypothetical protein